MDDFQQARLGARYVGLLKGGEGFEQSCFVGQAIRGGGREGEEERGREGGKGRGREGRNCDVTNALKGPYFS